jgi:hypothetical protein
MYCEFIMCPGYTNNILLILWLGQEDIQLNIREFIPVFFGGIRIAHLFSFFVLSYNVSLRSEFRDFR